MRKVIIKTHDCNRCQRQCNGDVIRGKRGDLKKFLTCPGWQQPWPMRTSLLERASENTSTFSALNVILESVGMHYHESTRYPFFTLRIY